MHKGLTFAIIVLLLGVLTPLQTARAATDPAWKGEYFTNTTLSGSPAFTRQDPFIDFNWEGGPPYEGGPVDNFSVRWTRRVDFERRVYIFAARSDDGFRIYVDGKLVLDRWSPQNFQWSAAEVLMSAGQHTVVVEFYEEAFSAAIQAGYYPKADNVTSTPAPTATPTAGFSPTPTPTRTPTLTPTITPTSPFIIGTPGAQPLLLPAPPILTNATLVNWTDSKFFTWDGFPGPATWPGGQHGSYGYVKNRQDRPTFEARWNFISPEGGYYDVYVYIPPSQRPTTQASYFILSWRERIGPLIVDQSVNGDRWVLLGTYYFAPARVQYVALTNATAEPDASREVLLDTVMFVYKP